MANIIKRETSIDAETGEVYYQKEWSSFNGWSADGYKYRYRYNALKLYPDNFPNLPVANHFRTFIALCYCMNEDNLFVNKVRAKSKYESPEVEPLLVYEIKERLPYSVSSTAFDSCWRTLKKENLVKKIRVGNKFIWAVNPAYANRCHAIPLFLFSAFKEDLKPKLGEQNYKRYLNMELTEEMNKKGEKPIARVWKSEKICRK